jgi:hypothetical protein
MNQSFYENRTREKIKDLLDEGQRSQGYYRSGSRKSGMRAVLPELSLILIGILGALVILIF